MPAVAHSVQPCRCAAHAGSAPPVPAAAPPAAPAAPSLPDPECARHLQDERNRVEKERQSAEFRRLQSALDQDLPAARDALKRTLELGGSGELDLAGVQLELGDVDAADALVRAGLEKERARGSNADNLYFYFHLGEKIAERRGDAAVAAAARQQVIEATPSLQPETAFNLGSTYAVMRPPRVEAAERLLRSFVRNTCDKPNHAQLCDQCARARDLLEKLSGR